MVRAFVVLSLTMLCSGLIYQATQPALPKLFAERVGTLLQGGVLGVSMLVACVYLVSGGLQVLAGHLADRFPMKLVYVVCFALQVPLLMLASGLGGGPLMAVAMLMVSVNVGALPAENGLVASYSPNDRRGLAFGLKFILASGVSGFGVQMEGALYALFVVLAAIAAVGFAAACLLPSERRTTALAAAE
jgi:MFS transporter, FSR family, fosmidomycin resistance protein